MIVNLIDANGNFLYRGDDANRKAQDLIAGGARTVPVMPPDPRCTWDGNAWSEPPPKPEPPLTAEDLKKMLETAAAQGKPGDVRGIARPVRGA